MEDELNEITEMFGSLLGSGLITMNDLVENGFSEEASAVMLQRSKNEPVALESVRRHRKRPADDDIVEAENSCDSDESPAEGDTCHRRRLEPMRVDKSDACRNNAVGVFDNMVSAAMSVDAMCGEHDTSVGPDEDAEVEEGGTVFRPAWMMN